MKTIAKISYLVALCAIALLIIWSVGLLTIETFNLKVFEKQSSQFLAMAILPILATVAGAGIINIISNIGVIASYITKQEVKESRFNIKKILIGYCGLIVLLVVGLLAGNKLSDSIKQRELVNEFDSVIKGSESVLSKIVSVDFDPKNILSMRESMQFIDLQTKKLSSPEIVFACTYRTVESLCIASRNDRTIKSLKEMIMDNINSDSSASLDSLDYLWQADENEKEMVNGLINSKDSSIKIELDDNGKYVVYKYIDNGSAQFIFKMEKRERYGRLSS